MLYPIISPSAPTSGGCYTDYSDYISLSSSHPLYNSIESLRFSRPWHQNRTRSCNRSWCTWEFPPPSQLLDETSAARESIKKWVGSIGSIPKQIFIHQDWVLLFPTASPRPWPRVCRNSWCACASSETVNWQSWRTSFRPPRRAIWGCHGRRFGPRQARWMVRLGKLIESLIICSYFDGWMTGEYAWIVHILAALAFRLSGCWGLFRFRWNPPRGCWSLRKFRVWVDQWTLIVSHVCGFVGARKIEAKVGIK